MRNGACYYISMSELVALELVEVLSRAVQAWALTTWMWRCSSTHYHAWTMSSFPTEFAGARKREGTREGQSRSDSRSIQRSISTYCVCFTVYSSLNVRAQQRVLRYITTSESGALELERLGLKLQQTMDCITYLKRMLYIHIVGWNPPGIAARLPLSCTFPLARARECFLEIFDRACMAQPRTFTRYG